MPMMPPRKCHGCGRMVVGPCEDCARTRRERVDQKRDTLDYRKLYKTEKWKQASRRRLALNPWCVGFPLGYHGAARTLAQCTDHIKPAHRYPELFFDEANHQSLCFDCNTRKGQEDGSLSPAERRAALIVEAANRSGLMADMERNDAEIKAGLMAAMSTARGDEDA